MRLTIDERNQLLRAAREGDRKSRDRLILASQWIVRCIAKRYIGHAQFDDLMSWGNIGLIRAIDKIDLSRGEFSNYARRSIQNEIRINVFDYPYWLSKYVKKFYMLKKQSPTSSNEQIIATMDLTVNHKECLRAAIGKRDTEYIDEMVPTGNRQIQLFEDMCDYQILVKRLPKRNRVLLEKYYLKEMTSQQIGDQYNLTREWIRRIIKKSLEDLRTWANDDHN